MDLPRRLAVSLLLLSACLPGPAAAAEVSREGHLVVGAKLGAGVARLGDQVPEEDTTETGWAGNFSMGYGISPRWFLGLEASTWSDFGGSSPGNADLTFRAFGPSVAWYPGGGAFYLRGIVGWGRLEFQVQTVDGLHAKTDESGFGFALGAGYEWRISTLVALGPQLDLAYLDVGEVGAFTQVLGQSFDFSAWWLNATLSAHFYF